MAPGTTDELLEAGPPRVLNPQAGRVVGSQCAPGEMENPARDSERALPPGLGDVHVGQLERKVDAVTALINSLTQTLLIQTETSQAQLQEKVETSRQMCKQKQAHGTTVGEMKSFDQRNQVRPEKYSAAKSGEFLAWDALPYVMSLDAKWESIIQGIRKKSARRLKEEDCDEILLYSGVNANQLKTVSHGLFVTLLSFTSGEAHAKVMACGENDSFEAYRGLYA